MDDADSEPQDSGSDQLLSASDEGLSESEAEESDNDSDNQNDGDYGFDAGPDAFAGSKVRLAQTAKNPRLCATMSL